MKPAWSRPAWGSGCGCFAAMRRGRARPEAGASNRFAGRSIPPHRWMWRGREGFRSSRNRAVPNWGRRKNYGIWGGCSGSIARGFMIDHLDVFYRDGQAGLKIAYFISELRRLIPRSLSVLSVNQDLWEATFRGQLPSALEDRVTGGFVHLPGLSLAQANELIRSRLAAAGEPDASAAVFGDRLRLAEFFAGHTGRPVSPRAVLRYAAEKWRLTRSGESAGPREPGPGRSGWRRDRTYHASRTRRGNDRAVDGILRARRRDL